MAAPFAEALSRVLAARPPLLAAREPQYREAAVSLLLREGPELLFIKRAERAGDPWSGQIAFPGGRRQPGDPALVETARRETAEEIGLDPDAIGQRLGALDELEPSTKRLPPVIISPFVWAVPAEAPLAPATEEVESVLWVSLAALRDPAAATSYDFGPRSFPGIRIGSNVLWGLSYRILEGFLALARQAGL